MVNDSCGDVWEVVLLRKMLEKTVQIMSTTKWKDKVKTIMIEERVVALEHLNVMNHLVNVLFQLSESRKLGTVDIVATVQARKEVIDNYINKLAETERKVIKDAEDVFYIWLFDKVMNRGNEVVAGKKGEKMLVESENNGEDVGRNVGVDGAEAQKGNEFFHRKQVVVKKRKNQFSQAIVPYDVYVTKQNFTAASAAFTKQYIPRCGRKFLELRDRSRKKSKLARDTEVVASYYCSCGEKDDIYIQFRHDPAIDVVSNGNEERYRYRCYVKPEKANVVLNHFDWNGEEVVVDKILIGDHANTACVEEKYANDASVSGQVADMFGKVMFVEGEREIPGACKAMTEYNVNVNRAVTRASRRKILDEVCSVVNATITNDDKEMKKKAFVIGENCKTDNGVILVEDRSSRKRTKRERSIATYMIHEDDTVERSVDEVSDKCISTVEELKENICHGATVLTEVEVGSESGEDDNETREAFRKFRIES
jgi:hypothetical protein